MDRTATRPVAIAAAAGIAAALALPPSAAAGPAPDVDAVPSQPAGMRAALERDLGLDTDEAQHRLATDAAASELAAELRSSLDTSFGGAWVDDEQLVVAVTDVEQAGAATAAGARVELVTHSESELAEMVATLDRAPTPAAGEVYGWHVDITTNTVVVTAAPDAEAAAREFVAAAGLTGAAAEDTPVRVETSPAGPPVTYPDLIGGHPFFFGSSRCSIGFSVLPAGFVTAGHCGTIGTQTQGFDGTSQGVVVESDFPGADAGYVEVNSSWTPRPWVWRYSGSQVFVVQGSQPAPVGAATCRSGSTTGWQCGTILALNQTVNYPQGTVTGLTATSACAESGDSGGSFVAAGGQAQGVTSGGSGNCTFGGTTYFQPLNPVLNAYNLTLVTG